MPAVNPLCGTAADVPEDGEAASRYLITWPYLFRRIGEGSHLSAAGGANFHSRNSGPTVSVTAQKNKRTNLAYLVAGASAASSMVYISSRYNKRGGMKIHLLVMLFTLIGCASGSTTMLSGSMPSVAIPPESSEWELRIMAFIQPGESTK